MKYLKKIAVTLFSIIFKSVWIFLGWLSDIVFKATKNPAAFEILNVVFNSLLSSTVTILRTSNTPSLRFSAPGAMARYRAITALNKEPATIDWLRSVSKQGVLLDVGCNVGIYSVIFLRFGGLHCHCVDPNFSNMVGLLANLKLNDVEQRATVWPLPLYSGRERVNFCQASLEIGGALSTVSSSLSPDQFSVGVYSTRVDDLTSLLPEADFPTALKLDVDGNEIAIIEGAENTLNDNRLTDVLIEVDDRFCCGELIKQLMKRFGFFYFGEEVTSNSNDFIISNVFFKKTALGREMKDSR